MPCRRLDTSAVGCLSRPCGNVREVWFLRLAARNIHALTLRALTLPAFMLGGRHVRVMGAAK
ncbi:hypothetical protein BQ8794_130280 [Mesorhizobium prunaredense]|uniref:Transposase n=1 Tax=Mesorhizobium prunaredense TaxID=1631249 RepID=A0A1R3V1M4_9HYPH|nr:hypothetical protein BQ8794_130280 [Mesorhizobium prunaredense]